jgi:site-specific recombinase XerD
LKGLFVVQPKTVTPIERTVADYLSWCRARNLSPKSIHGYEATLTKVFLPWCKRERITDLSQLSQKRLDALGEELLTTGGERGALSPWSVKTYLRVVNQLLAWAKADGEKVEAHAQIPNTPKTLVDVLSREEIQRLEDTAGNERDKLIVRLLADTGMRVGELVKLRTTDLVERDRANYVQVRGKGARDRLVPVPKLYRRLQKYVERVRPQDLTSNRLFVGLRKDRRTGDYEPLAPSGVAQMLGALAQTAAIKKRVHPHLLRHSFATWSLTKGTNPVQLAKVLGHSSLTMINNVYSHLSPSDSYEAMARLLMAEDD